MILRQLVLILGHLVLILRVLTTILISMATSIVFHENKRVNLVLEVKDKLCAMTLEVDTWEHG